MTVNITINADTLEIYQDGELTSIKAKETEKKDKPESESDWIVRRKLKPPEKSQMTRMDAACATASIIRELCEDVSVYATAGSDGRRIHATKLVPARHGMALTDAITGMNSVLGEGGIFLKQVMDYVNEHEKSIDRVIVITDEQDCANHPEDMPKNALPLGTTRYMLNVGNNKNGIGYGKWTHIDGFSENVVKYILEIENN